MPISLRGAGLETTGTHLVAVFTLNEPPEPAWISAFRERSAYSVFDLTTAAFRRNRLYVELPLREELACLIESIEGLITSTNIDLEFRRAE
jgi:hypothetical protein